MGGGVRLILAHAGDPVALALAGCRATGPALLLTPADLATPGWCYRPGAVADSVAVAGGRRFRGREIGGVLVRMVCVAERDLPQIAPDDRAYVAAEMQAMLVAWLDKLPCPVLNRPTPLCLSGPFWRHEQWVHLAASLGLPIHPTSRAAGGPAAPLPPPARGATTITIVGDAAIGGGEATLIDRAHALATAAGVDLLAVAFDAAESGRRFLGASPWPDVTAPAVAEAVDRYLDGRGVIRARW